MPSTVIVLVIALVIALGLFLALAVAHYVFWTRRLTVEMPYAETHAIAMPDGAPIELRRLPGDATSKGAPILLVHGVGIDHRNNDPLPHRSLARTLASRGHDVWLLRLRSGGTVRELGGRGWSARRHVHFAAMARYDVPLGVAAVLEKTGAAQLDYVGFSMGGMLLYASLSQGTLDPRQLRRAVILGSPARVGAGMPLLGWLSRLPRALVPAVPLRLPARMFAFSADWPTSRLASLVFNRANVEPGVSAKVMMTIESIPSGLGADFLDFVRRGKVHVDDRDVLEGLEALTIPALFFAGARDGLAPPEAVRAAFDRWGSAHPAPDKRFVLLSSERCAHDYGHGDLAIGRHAEQDIFLPVARFLEEPPRERGDQP